MSAEERASSSVWKLLIQLASKSVERCSRGEEKHRELSLSDPHSWAGRTMGDHQLCLRPVSLLLVRCALGVFWPLLPSATG